MARERLKGMRSLSAAALVAAAIAGAMSGCATTGQAAKAAEPAKPPLAKPRLADLFEFLLTAAETAAESVFALLDENEVASPESFLMMMPATPACRLE